MNKKQYNINLEGHKLIYHVKEVSDWLDGKNVAPIYVEIGPSNICNHHCLFCALDYMDKSKKVIMEKNTMFNLLENMANFGVKSIMFAGEGEPMIYPHIIEATQKAKNFGLDIAITTNGVAFNPQKCSQILPHLSWIKFSIDAGDAEIYSKIHGCKPQDFETLMNNLNFACQMRQKQNLSCTIGAQMLMLEQSIQTVEKLTIQVRNLGLDYLVLKPYSQHPKSINHLSFDRPKYDAMLIELTQKYSTENFKLIYRNLSAKEIEQDEIPYEQCYGVNFFALIEATGDIIPCNLFHDSDEFIYGNLYKQSFEEIWKGKQRQEILNKLQKRGCNSCRKGCRLHHVNKYLNVLVEKNIEHINFI